MYIESSPTAHPRPPSCSASPIAKPARSEAHPRQPLQLATRSRRRGSASCSRAAPRCPASRRPSTSSAPAARPCRRGAGNVQEARSRQADRPEALAKAQPGAGHDRGADPGTRLEAGHGTRPRRGHGGEHPGRDPRSRLDEDDLYGAMDWLLERQERIERSLAKRHLEEGSLVLCDLTSVWMEGTRCPLARRGHSGTAGRARCRSPRSAGATRTAVRCRWSVPGNTADPNTVGSQVAAVRERFSLARVVLVGDRGMLTAARIREEVKPSGLDWISALRGPAIRALVEAGAVEMSLFDERDLVEITSDAYPGSASWCAAIPCWPMTGPASAQNCSRPPRPCLSPLPRRPGATRAVSRGEEDRRAGRQGHRQVQDGEAHRVVHR